MFGQRLKIERKRLQLSQKEFSEACGVSHRAQCNYEDSTRLPNVKYLQNAHNLGVDVTYLITGTPVKEAVTDEESIFLQKFRTLSDGQKQIMLGFLSAGADDATPK